MKGFVIEEGGYYKHLDMLFLYRVRVDGTWVHLGRLLLKKGRGAVWRDWCIEGPIAHYLTPLSETDKKKWRRYMKDTPPP